MSKQGKQHIRAIISGGGTGGHIYPAIAIADALKAKDAGAAILFVGAQGKMEMEKVPQAGYQIVGLWISGLQRRLTLQNLSFPFKVIHSWWKARALVKSFKPDVVIGVGGYASGPMMQAAIQAKVPTLIQEQNGYAGLTNKMVANKVNAVCVAYPNMEQYFPKEKIKFTGNPVRKDILELDSIKAEALEHFGLEENRKTVLVLGGSLGAKTINESMQQGINDLLKADYQVLWQTGKYYYEGIREALGNDKDGMIIKAFITRMDYAYACADVVVSRAGALSISELCLAGKPAVFVPSPNVAEDHQTKNAMALVKQGAAIVVKDIDARNLLVKETLALLSNESKQQELAKNIKALAKPQAAIDIAATVFKIAGFE